MMFTRAELMRATNPRSRSDRLAATAYHDSGLWRAGGVRNATAFGHSPRPAHSPADGESVFSRHDSSRRAKGPQYRPAEG